MHGDDSPQGSEADLSQIGSLVRPLHILPNNIVGINTDTINMTMHTLLKSVLIAGNLLCLEF